MIFIEYSNTNNNEVVLENKMDYHLHTCGNSVRWPPPQFRTTKISPYRFTLGTLFTIMQLGRGKDTLGSRLSQKQHFFFLYLYKMCETFDVNTVMCRPRRNKYGGPIYFSMNFRDSLYDVIGWESSEASQAFVLV